MLSCDGCYVIVAEFVLILFVLLWLSMQCAVVLLCPIVCDTALHAVC